MLCNMTCPLTPPPPFSPTCVVCRCEGAQRGSLTRSACGGLHDNPERPGRSVRINSRDPTACLPGLSPKIACHVSRQLSWYGDGEGDLSPSIAEQPSPAQPGPARGRVFCASEATYVVACNSGAQAEADVRPTQQTITHTNHQAQHRAPRTAHHAPHDAQLMRVRLPLCSSPPGRYVRRRPHS